jgi:hypothetical protein
MVSSEIQILFFWLGHPRVHLRTLAETALYGRFSQIAVICQQVFVVGFTMTPNMWGFLLIPGT